MADDPTTPDSALALDIKETLTDRAGLEVSAVTLGNVPPGAVLSAGADNGDGTWSLAVDDLDGLAITPPPGWTGEINLVVSALSKSGDAATPTTTAFGISVMPVGVEAPPPPPDQAPEQAPEPTPEPAPEPEAEASPPPPDQAPDQAPEPSPEPPPEPSGEPLAFALEIDTGLRPPADGDGDFILGIAVTRAGEVVTSGSLVVTVDGSLSATPDIPLEPGPVPEPGPAPAPEPVPAPAPETGPGEPAAGPEIEDESTPESAPGPGPAPAAYWKLDETAPGRAADEIGGHHGLTHGAGDEDAPGSPGSFDAVAVFDGVDDCIEIPTAEALAPAGGALTVWFNAYATGGGTLAAKGAGDFALRLDNGRLAFAMPSPEGPRKIDAGPFGANEWNQATVTWGPAGMKTYLNGQSIASDDFAGGLTDNPAPWFFGAAETAAPEGETRSLGDFFHGELDDIAIYAGQLGAAEVRDLGHFGIDGVMTGKTPADMDSALDLGAIPAEADGPESLATVDAMPSPGAGMPSPGAGMDDAGAGAPVPEPVPEPEPAPMPAPPLIDPAAEEPASPKGSGDVDSALDLDAIPAEAEGPESLATVDTDADTDAGAEAPEAPEIEEPAVPDPVPEAPPKTPQETPPETRAEEEEGDVFVFGAGQGGDYAPGADGWSETATPRESADDPDGEAITVAEGDELIIEGPEKMEW
ncbi:MAG: hypothetical protein IH994_04315 [Proteobacteria bacterium]|nr:hypothetical protein [Pseudomonadota bacterium]